jgi:hypothetical protein
MSPEFLCAVERQYQTCYPPKRSGYLDERTDQGMSGKENTLLPMPDPALHLHRQNLMAIYFL